jgi:hypothetical protein
MKTRSLLLSLVLVLIPSLSISDEYLKSWIPSTCCVTNDCCWEIQDTELKYHPKIDEYEIKSTGQTKKYEFSPNNRYYRCACDYDNVNKTWVKHQGANTRCLFVPRPSS